MKNPAGSENNNRSDDGDVFYEETLPVISFPIV